MENDNNITVEFKNESLPVLNYFSISLVNTKSNLDEVTANSISSYKKKKSDFNIIDIRTIKIQEKTGLKIIYTYTDLIDREQKIFKVIEIWLKFGSTIYKLVYNSEIEKFSTFFPNVHKMINSLYIHSIVSIYYPTANFAPKKEEFFSTITSYPNSKYLYFSSWNEDKVVRLTKDKFDHIDKKEIIDPVDIAIDNIGNKFNIVFVSQPTLDRISVLKESESGYDNISNIQFPPQSLPTNMLVNRVTNTLYVTNSGSNTISVIDYDLDNIPSGIEIFNYTKPKQINVGIFPNSITSNRFTNTLYVTNSGSNTVSVINGTNNTILKEIPVGKEPFSSHMNSFTNTLYVTNSGSNTVSVINSTNNNDTVINEISVDKVPIRISGTGNSENYDLYIANAGSNTISIINSTNNNNTIVKKISLNNIPLDFFVEKKIVYVLGVSPNGAKINVIKDYKQIDKDPVKFKFDQQKGRLECNNSIEPSILYDNNTEFNCKVYPNTGYIFDEWILATPKKVFSEGKILLTKEKVLSHFKNTTIIFKSSPNLIVSAKFDTLLPWWIQDVLQFHYLLPWWIQDLVQYGELNYLFFAIFLAIFAVIIHISRWILKIIRERFVIRKYKI